MGGIYWLASYPKSGSTWFRIWLGHLRGLADRGDAAADLDALDTPIASSRDWLDTILGFDTADLDFDEIDRLRPTVYDWRQNDPRVTYHKTHDAYTRSADGTPLLGRTATLGAVYIVRNPLDVAPSYAAHGGITIDRAIEQMGDPAHAHNVRTDRLTGQVRQRYLDWSGHVRSWIDAGTLPVNIVRYEDMSRAPEATLAAAARFLGLPDDPSGIAAAVRGGRFDRLQAQERDRGFAERPPGMAAFFREGRTGGWRDRLDARQVARIVADHGATMQRLGYLDPAGNLV